MPSLGSASQTAEEMANGFDCLPLYNKNSRPYPGGIAYSEGLGAIIGIKSDGSLCAVYNDNNGIRKQYTEYGNGSAVFGTFTSEKLQKIVAQFSNIKELSFQIITSDSDASPVYIVALTKDNKLQVYKDGVFVEKAANDICAVFPPEYVLKTNGDLQRLSDQKIVLHDIINVSCSIRNIGFAITRTGTIYQCNFSSGTTYDEWHNINCITSSYDEWLARLN